MSIADTLKILQFCTKPSKYSVGRDMVRRNYLHVMSSCYYQPKLIIATVYDNVLGLRPQGPSHAFTWDTGLCNFTWIPFKFYMHIPTDRITLEFVVVNVPSVSLKCSSVWTCHNYEIIIGESINLDNKWLFFHTKYLHSQWC